ncbi:MAG TPA: helix-turn-helix domain-containing protein [Solirubrobacterales bacterium]|nr:helix-turn-helix domain-containing protein [Solirubrobacterales bacterium]
MPRARLHSDDTVLDATAGILLAEGARSASVKAIAGASGAPVGSIYHRYGSRDGVLVALWERAVRRFHASYIPAEVPGPDPVATGVAMAASVAEFAHANASDAQILMTLRPEDLLDGKESFERLNAGIVGAVRRLGDALPVDGERVRMAVVDLPYGAVRRHLAAGRSVSPALAAEVGAAAHLLLSDGEGA